MDSGVWAVIVQETVAAAGNVSGIVNYSVSIGDLLTAATTIIAVVAAYTRLTDRLKSLEIKNDVLWDDYRRRQRNRHEGPEYEP